MCPDEQKLDMRYTKKDEQAHHCKVPTAIKLFVYRFSRRTSKAIYLTEGDPPLERVEGVSRGHSMREETSR